MMKILVFIFLIFFSNSFCIEKNEDYYLENYVKAHGEYYLENNPQKALEILTFTIKDFPDKTGLYALKSDILMDIGKYEEAINVLSDGISNNETPDKLHLYRRRLLLYEKINREDLADTDWDVIKGLSINIYVDTLTIIALYNHRKEFEKALLILNELIKNESNGNFLYALMFRVDTYYKKGSYEEALADLDSLFKAYEKANMLPRVMLVFKYSIIYYKLGDIDNATLFFRKAINAYSIEKQIYDFTKENVSIEEFLKPYEGDLDIINFEEIMRISDVVELNDKISLSNKEILKEILSIIIKKKQE